MSSAAVQSARKSVEQLRSEAGISRMKVSQAAQDLVGYCTTHQVNDPLLVGIPNNENPFKEKVNCLIL
ncbi:guanine nucleotide-binding protein G(I)/G(S)/G(O) subunit gamma-7-like [Sycon ciliatum]|uniref:guanine nucleotide-binding protein G(I)/G(S)/G(O) subunit gamma-7-like n=1 Tax=Sycon ciliatum TaxID=27933 RepID=UPI0020AEC56D